MIPIQDIYRSNMKTRAIDTAQSTIDKMVKFDCTYKLDDIKVEQGSGRFLTYVHGLNSLLNKNIDVVTPVQILIESMSEFEESFLSVKSPRLSGDIEYTLVALDNEDKILNLELDVDIDNSLQNYSIFFRANDPENRYIPEQPTLISRNSLQPDHLVFYHPTKLKYFNQVAQKCIGKMRKKGLRVIENL